MAEARVVAMVRTTAGEKPAGSDHQANRNVRRGPLLYSFYDVEKMKPDDVRWKTVRRRSGVVNRKSFGDMFSMAGKTAREKYEDRHYESVNCIRHVDFIADILAITYWVLGLTVCQQ